MELSGTDHADLHAQLAAQAAQLAAVEAQLDAQMAAHKQAIKARDLQIEKLKHQLAGMRRHRFGSSSESLEQLELSLEEAELAAATEEPPEPEQAPEPGGPIRDKGSGQEKAQACPAAGPPAAYRSSAQPRRHVWVRRSFAGDRRGRHRRAGIHPRALRGPNRIVRPRLACTACEAITQADLPSRPIERGRPGPGLLAHVLVSKYADHLPLYRQSQIYQRDGLELSRSTLADWVGKSTALLAPLADEIGRHVRAGPALFADDTPLALQDPGGGKTKTAQAVGLCPRRAPLGWSRAAGRLVPVLHRSQRQACPGSPSAESSNERVHRGLRAEKLVLRQRVISDQEVPRCKHSIVRPRSILHPSKVALSSLRSMAVRSRRMPVRCC